MHPAFQFLLATFVFMLLHVSAMALCARAFGITIRRIAYGVGPALFSVGKMQLRLMPFAGSVVLKDTREEEIYDDDRGDDIYNERPLWQQLAVPLGGVVVPLILALGLLGAQGWDSFTLTRAATSAKPCERANTSPSASSSCAVFKGASAPAIICANAPVKLSQPCAPSKPSARIKGTTTPPSGTASCCHSGRSL